ncbi:MAG: hypothetical protein IPM42_17185 [Saprospiraceae bacterium]|nr:hypothetical protein [Saprospiraceae bacterium]
MKILTSILFCIFVLYSCKDEYQVKPMKYNRNGEQLSCKGFYKNEELLKVVCFYPSNDTLLVEYYKDNLFHGPFVRFHENGIVSQTGQYENDRAEGVWVEYNPNGERKSYKYYSRDYDYKCIYLKEKKPSDSLESLIYHFEFGTDSEDGKFYIGKKYRLMIELTHSEFDSVEVAGSFGEFPDPKTYNDNFMNEGRILAYPFVPKKVGKNVIYGEFYEYNALEPDTIKSFGGNRLFKYEYFVEE